MGAEWQVATLPEGDAMNSREPYPEPGIAARAASVVPVLASLFPGLGGPASQLVSMVLALPLGRRRDAWLNDIAERLAKVEQTVEEFTVEALADDEEFVTAMLTATQIALRNHDATKLAALRNAVVNVALHREPDAELQSIFLSFVDQLTPLHMQLLVIFRDKPTSMENPLEGTDRIPVPEEYVRVFLPNLPENTYDLLCLDLENRKLVVDASKFMMGGIPGQLTKLGHKFVDFISEQ